MNLEEKSYLGIGTLESYEKLKAYWRGKRSAPIYIEVEDGERLEAGNREGRDAGSTEIRRNVPEISGRCTGFQ